MKKVVLMSYVCTGLLFAFNANAGQKIKHCGSNAKQEMAQALDFVQDNLETIMGDTSRITSKEKKKLRKKVKNVNLKCMDHKPVCRNHNDRAGVSRHLFNSAVVVCYNRIRDFYGNNAFCALVDTIIHEFGHTAGVYKAKDHNDGPNNDRVYRLGDAAESLCNSRGLDSSIPRNTND
ncbi:MAG: Zn-dependent M32 family carboxypeptidase [Bacteriovoracaceae bacterium]|jgi:Zn-dependent M32 family carboxypeptidase